MDHVKLDITVPNRSAVFKTHPPALRSIAELANIATRTPAPVSDLMVLPATHSSGTFLPLRR